MHGINGYVFGNLPGLDMTAGQRVRWYLMAWAARSTCTPPYWHGNTVVVAGMRTDVSNLLPATMQVADEDALRVIDSTACPRSCADCFAGSGRN